MSDLNESLVSGNKNYNINFTLIEPIDLPWSTLPTAVVIIKAVLHIPTQSVINGI